MSVEAMAMVLHHSRAKGTAKLILIGIANHAGDGGAYPTKETLAKYANLADLKQVGKHLKTLRSLGEIRIHVQGGGDRDCEDYKRPNRYDVLVQCPAWCDRSMNHKDTRKTRQTALLTMPRIPVDNPGVESDPGSNPIPRPGSQDDPQTVPTTGPPPGGASTTGHASDVEWRSLGETWVPPVPPGPPCSVCSRSAVQCQAAQARWTPADRHPYTPRRDTP